MAQVKKIPGDENANQYPYWKPEFRQNPFILAGVATRQALAELSHNREPLRGSRMTNVKVIRTPRVQQPTRDVPKGDKMQNANGQTGSLVDLLNAGITKQTGVKS